MKKKICWRAVAGWFFLILGGMLAVFSLVIFVWMYPQEHVAFKGILGSLASLFVGGVIWVYAGLGFIRGKIRLAIAMAIIGFVFGIYGNAQINNILINI